jgi:hypothetical protein
MKVASDKINIANASLVLSMGIGGHLTWSRNAMLSHPELTIRYRESPSAADIALLFRGLANS